jgi:hypothetical protein
LHTRFPSSPQEIPGSHRRFPGRPLRPQKPKGDPRRPLEIESIENYRKTYNFQRKTYEKHSFFIENYRNH